MVYTCNLPLLNFYLCNSLKTNRVDLAAYKASIYGVSNKSKGFINYQVS